MLSLHKSCSSDTDPYASGEHYQLSHLPNSHKVLFCQVLGCGHLLGYHLSLCQKLNAEGLLALLGQYEHVIGTEPS